MEAVITDDYTPRSVNMCNEKALKGRHTIAQGAIL